MAIAAVTTIIVWSQRKEARAESLMSSGKNLTLSLGNCLPFLKQNECRKTGIEIHILIYILYVCMYVCVQLLITMGIRVNDHLYVAASRTLRKG